MTQKKSYLIKTNYFRKPWTWTKRFLEFLVGLGFMFWIYSVEAKDNGTEYYWVKYCLLGILTMYIFCRPKDELAVDEENLYYMKKSILPLLNRTTQYGISKMKSIGCGGFFDTDTELLGRARPTRNRLEIIFKDNSSRSHDVTIYKSELRVIVNTVSRLINQSSA
jgi:hypothetical protein